MKKPLISVIVPVYNVEKYLNRCVESIRKQTYQNLEIILVDDGSTDCSGALCDKYSEEDKRIRVIHKENGGLSDARNAALDVATGEYITCIDSDDFVSAYYVENLYTAVAESGSEISCSWFVDYYDSDPLPLAEPVRSEQIQVLDREAFFRKMLYQDGVEVSACGKLYKQSVFNNVRYPKGKLYEDIVTTYRTVEKAERIAVIPHIDYFYYQRSGSIARNKFMRRQMDAVVHMDMLRKYMIARYPALKQAAECRYFSTVCNILFLIDSEEFIEEKIYLWGEVKKYRKDVLFDKSGRKKARVAAALSFFGYGMLKAVYSRVKRKK